MRGDPLRVSIPQGFSCSGTADLLLIGQERRAAFADVVIEFLRQTPQLVIETGAQKRRFRLAQVPSRAILEKRKNGAHDGNYSQERPLDAGLTGTLHEDAMYRS
jgi:hypothetical protein